MRGTRKRRESEKRQENYESTGNGKITRNYILYEVEEKNINYLDSREK